MGCKLTTNDILSCSKNIGDLAKKEHFKDDLLLLVYKERLIFLLNKPILKYFENQADKTFASSRFTCLIIFLSPINMRRNQKLKALPISQLNPFHVTDLFWYPLKTSENQRFSDVFRGYQKRSVTWNGLIGGVDTSEIYKDCKFFTTLVFSCEFCQIFKHTCFEKNSCGRFSDVFRGYRRRTVAWNGLMRVCFFERIVLTYL